MAAAVFETDRLLVRLYEPDDASFVLDMYSRWDVQRFLGAAPKTMQSLEQAHVAIQRWRAVSDPHPLQGVWAITLRDGTRVGTVMLKLIPLTSELRPMPLSNDYEVGWHLHPDHWGHGYATEAAAGALRRAFEAGLSEVFALILPGNERSERVAGRLGMRDLGLTDRYYSFQAHIYEAHQEQP